MPFPYPIPKDAQTEFHSLWEICSCQIYPMLFATILCYEWLLLACCCSLLKNGGLVFSLVGFCGFFSLVCQSKILFHSFSVVNPCLVDVLVLLI